MLPKRMLEFLNGVASFQFSAELYTQIENEDAANLIT